MIGFLIDVIGFASSVITVILAALLIGLAFVVRRCTSTPDVRKFHAFANSYTLLVFRSLTLILDEVRYNRLFYLELMFVFLIL